MAFGKSLEKPPVWEAVLHYNKNGLPVRAGPYVQKGTAAPKAGRKGG
jgi:hypothetical protein